MTPPVTPTVTPAVTLGEVLDSVRTGAGVRTRVDGEPAVLAAACPAGHAAALARAVGEALRNVARHSGTDEALLRVTRGEGGHGEVAIIDRGQGFPGDLLEGYGITHSLRGPVEALGGTVTTSGTPGGGATVVVALPPPPQEVRPPAWSAAGLERTYRRTVLTAGGSMSLVRAVAWPQGLVWTYLAVAWSLRVPEPVPLLLLAAALVVVTGGVARRLEQGPPTLPWVGAVAAVLVAAQVTALLLLPDGSMLDYRSWTVGFVGVSLMALCLFLPPSLALVVALPHSVVVLVAAALSPGLTEARLPIGSLNASLLPALLGLVVGVLLRSTGDVVLKERSRLSHAQRALARQRALAGVSSLHLAHTREAVVPWLERVAGGAVRADDEQVRAQARTLAMEVRDDLYAPGFLSPELRSEVSEARERGAVIEIGAGFVPGEGASATTAVLRDLVPRLASGARLTIAARHGQVRLALVPSDEVVLARARALARSPEHAIELDADDVRLVLRLRDHPGTRGVTPGTAMG